MSIFGRNTPKTAAEKEREYQRGRSDLMGSISERLKELQGARDQGKLSHEGYLVKVDDTVRQAMQANPSRAEDVAEWVKEDLGIKPFGNAFNYLEEQHKVQEDAKNEIVKSAVKDGLELKDKKTGLVDRERTIEAAQKRNLSIANAALAASDLQKTETGVTEALYTFLKTVEEPTFERLFKEAEAFPTDEEKKAAAMLLLDQRQAEFHAKVLGPLKVSRPMTPERWAAVTKDIDEGYFGTKRNALFGEHGTWEQSRKLADLHVAETVTKLKAAAPIQAANSEVFKGNYGAAVFMHMLNSKNQTALETEFENIAALASASAALSEGASGRAATGLLDSGTRKMLGGATKAGLDEIRKADTLKPEDANVLISTLAARLDLVKTTKKAPQQLQGFFKEQNDQKLFGLLEQAAGNSASKAQAKTLISDIAVAARGHLENIMPDTKIKIREITEDGKAGGISYNADTGMIVSSFSYDSYKPQSGFTGLNKIIGAPVVGGAFMVRKAEMDKNVTSLNEVLNVYGMSRSTLDRSFSAEEYKLAAARKLGISISGYGKGKQVEIPVDSDAIGKPKTRTWKHNPETGRPELVGEE